MKETVPFEIPKFLDPKTNLDKAEEEKFYDLLQRLGKFVFLNRILLKPHFQDKVTLF